MKNDFFKLMLVTNKSSIFLDEYLKFIISCVESGLTSIQLREKNLTYDELLEFGQKLQFALRSFALPLIVNDYVDLCVQLNAFGVHLGQGDGDVLEARKILGKNKVIGLTVDTFEQLDIANDLPLDYIGVGAIFPTKNKLNVTSVWGLERLKQAVNKSKHPVIAIGGICENNVFSVMQVGVSGIAAIGVFHDSQDCCATTKNLRSIIDNKINA